jgi:hypothetical protein
VPLVRNSARNTRQISISDITPDRESRGIAVTDLRFYCGETGRRASTTKMVAGSRIGPELASAANTASISRAIVWRVNSAGLFSSMSLAVGPIIIACCASSSGLPPMIVGWARSTVTSANPPSARNPRI